MEKDTEKGNQWTPPEDAEAVEQGEFIPPQDADVVGEPDPTLLDEWRRGRYQRAMSEKIKALIDGREYVTEAKGREVYEEALEDRDPLLDRRLVEGEGEPWFSFNLFAEDDTRSFRHGNSVDVDDNRKQELAQEIVQIQERLAQIPNSEAMKLVQESLGSDKSQKDKLGDILTIAGTHPSLIPELMTSSIASAPEALALGVLGSIGGTPGMMAGSFVGSLSAEEANAFTNAAQNAGIDISDPEQMLAMIENESIRDEIKKNVDNRALAVGTVDALFGLLTAGVSRAIPNRLVSTPIGIGADIVGEGTSELAGQAAEGSELDFAEAGLESVGSLGTSATQVASYMASPEVRQAARNASANRTKQDTGVRERVVEQSGEEESTTTIDDIQDAVNANDPEVDSDSNQALEDLKDTLDEQRTDNDQQQQPEGDTEEVLGVGEESEPGSGVPSGEANQEANITVTPGFGFSEPSITGSDLEVVSPSVVDLGETGNNEISLTGKIEQEAQEASNDYIDQDNLKTPKRGILKNLVNDFSQNFETFIAEVTEGNKGLRDLLVRDFLDPAYKVIGKKFIKENQAADLIKKYRGKVDDEKLFFYAVMKEEDGNSIDFKQNELRKSSRNSRKKVRDKRVARTEELIQEYNEKGDAMLSETEAAYYDEAVNSFLGDMSEDNARIADQFFKRKINTFKGFFPRIVEGFTEQNQLKRDVEGLDDFQSADQVFDETGNSNRNLSAPASGRFKERKGIGDGYYNHSFTDSFSRGVRDLSTDVNLAPAIYKMKQMLNNPSFQEAIGTENAQMLTERIKSFIAHTKGFTNRKGMTEAEIRKVISTVKSVYLADPSQLVKQFVPGALGMASFYWNRPGSIMKGIRMMNSVDNAWLQENAPGLYVRKQSLDNLVESTLTEKQQKGKKINIWLNHADYAISAMLFFTEYADRGGTLQDVNKQAAGEALLTQSRVQGTNSLAFAPKQYVNQPMWMQIFMAFTMMPLNITRQIFRNINPAKLGNRERRMMLTMGVANVVVFQAVSEIVREFYDEVGDVVSNTFGEGEDEEMFNGIDELMTDGDVWKKIAVKSAMDAAVGWAPPVVQDPLNRYIFDPVKQGIISEEEANSSEFQIYYGNNRSNWDNFGVAGSLVEDAGNAVDAVIKAAESGDEEAMTYAMTYFAEVAATIGARKGSWLGAGYGPTLRLIREIKNSYKDEYREAIKEMKEDKKVSRRRTIIR